MRTAFTALALVVTLPALAVALPPEPAPPGEWLFAHDFRVRPGGAPDITPQTPLIGVEVYTDAQADAVIAATSAGGLAVAPFQSPGGESQAKWAFAHDLKTERDAKTPQYGVEAYLESLTGQLIFASQTGGLALATGADKPNPEGTADWHHALTLRTRKADETHFGPASKSYTVDCYRDGVSGTMLYCTEAGGLTVQAKPSQPVATDAESQAPVARYGLTLKVRTPKGAKATRKDSPTVEIGVEVYLDPNTGGLIYVSETGSVAAAPAPAELKRGESAAWQRGFTLKARPGGNADFAAATPMTVEVYADPNTGHTVYVTNAGSIAVLPKK